MFASILKKDQNTQTVKKSTFVIGEYKTTCKLFNMCAFNSARKHEHIFGKPFFNAANWQVNDDNCFMDL